MQEPVKLDVKDRRIISLLDENSRQSDTKIGKEIRKSPQFVRYRINQLIMNGVIIGNNAVVDYDKLGLRKFLAYVKFENIYPELLDQIALFFAGKEECHSIMELDGNYDLAVSFLLKDASAFSKIWDEFKAQYCNCIDTYKMLIVHGYELYPQRFLYSSEAEKYPLVITQRDIRCTLDKADREIINTLSEDSRTHLVQISLKGQMTSTAVAARIKKLEKTGIILGYKTSIRYRRIGYVSFLVEIMLDDMSIRRGLIEYIKNHDGLSEFYSTFNGADLEFRFIAQDQTEFLAIMQKTLNRFKGKIRQFSYSTVVKSHKSRYMVSLAPKETA